MLFLLAPAILEGINIGVDVCVGCCDLFGVSASTVSGWGTSSVFISVGSVKVEADEAELSEVVLSSESLPEEVDEDVLLEVVLVLESGAPDCPLYVRYFLS